MTDTPLATDRLILRNWKPTDRPPFAEMNADREVMEFFPTLLTRERSDALVDRFERELGERGFGPFAVELRVTGEFIGFVGLAVVPTEVLIGPNVEVGWRLARRFWGHGYATEAARASLEFGFHTAGLSEIVAMTSVVNTRSQRVMERLGMTHDPHDDFDHPRIAVGHALRRNVLYRKRSEQFGTEDLQI